MFQNKLESEADRRGGDLSQEPGGGGADGRVPWEELLREESLVRAQHVGKGCEQAWGHKEGVQRDQGDWDSCAQGEWKKHRSEGGMQERGQDSVGVDPGWRKAKRLHWRGGRRRGTKTGDKS